MSYKDFDEMEEMNTNDEIVSSNIDEEKEETLDMLKREILDECMKTIMKQVSIFAEVGLKPRVTVDEDRIDIHCKGTKIHEDPHCRGGKSKSSRDKHWFKAECNFIIEQEILVKIPMNFGVDVEAKQLGIDCD